MSIEQDGVIDHATIDKASGDVWLSISDHLPWDKEEDRHLLLLQNKINTYLRFIESGEILASVSDSAGRKVVIDVVGKFPTSAMADTFLRKASDVIASAGFRLQFRLLRAN